MSDMWIRLNGQDDLRENLRDTIDSSGLTRKALADLTGLPYSRLTAYLGGTQWCREADVMLLARALDVDFTELVGDSIFKGDPRSQEFNHRPVDRLIHGRRRVSPRSRTRALCCECGTLRTTTRPPTEEGERPTRDGSRQTAPLRCADCCAETTHALLLLDGSDPAETVNYGPTREQQSQRERDALVDRIAELGVDVYWIPRRATTRAKGYAMRYEFDESKSRWRIEVDPNAPARVQFTALQDAWHRIALNLHGVDWNPREGVICAVGGWADAAEELIEDIERFTSVERRRMAAGHSAGVSSIAATDDLSR